VTADDVLAALEMLVPDQPNLGFSLRDVQMPNLDFSDFNNANIGIGNLTTLRLPLPEWLKRITLVPVVPWSIAAAYCGILLLSCSMVM